ncbi:putative inactive receptor kinase [Forsythia ovata]|uniref:Inactive receptor kinase n=1 Tax=Forsythia ovata TaxID=205694 RepID=A0ABD1WM20_9LAMI
MGVKFSFSTILLFGALYLLIARAEPVEDQQALLDFINNIERTQNLNWDAKTSACDSWTGVTCNHDKSRVIAVRLPQVVVRGRIPSNTLARLSALQILSLRSNGISGPFPSDLLKLRKLTALYLQFNNFQGPLPSEFSVWKNLLVLDLSSNAFNGSIPLSISNLTHLEALNLANNSFSGNIPDLDIPSLKQLDLSKNNLTGVVPQSLLRFPPSVFAGNNISPDKFLPPALPPTLSPPRHSSKFSESAILGIVIGSCVLAIVLIVFLLIFTHRKKEDNKRTTLKSNKNEKTFKRATSEHQDGNGRLVFLEDCNIVFDLEDLLRASAEVLGKGTFGTTYKAALEDAGTVVVKRLKEASVGRKDFVQQMEAVANIRHVNVAAIRAYYYSKDEKLMVYDYYNQGSVSALLHGKSVEDRFPIDWESRLRIAIGAARGVAHIHSQSGGTLVHGNIKSSNIFLNSQRYGCVSDLGLATLMSPVVPPVIRTAGYRAPEVGDFRKVSQASDIYSFGVLLLELLTGKSPVHATGSDEVIHLVRWVHSVVHEEWTGEVFDIELLRYPNIEEEMVTMLQIGMSCVERIPEKRPKMADVVKMLEDIRSINAVNCPSTGTKSPGSSRTLTPSVSVIESSPIHN